MLTKLKFNEIAAVSGGGGFWYCVKKFIRETDRVLTQIGDVAAKVVPLVILDKASREYQQKKSWGIQRWDCESEKNWKSQNERGGGTSDRGENKKSCCREEWANDFLLRKVSVLLEEKWRSRAATQKGIRGKEVALATNKLKHAKGTNYHQLISQGEVTWKK